MPILTEIALLIFAYMTIWYLLAQYLHDNSIVDIAWGLGFVTIVWWIYFRHQPSFAYVPLLLATSLWGLRLAIHIGRRWLHKRTEDWRYQAWREEWGTQHRIQAFLKVFMLQGIFMWIIALPLLQTSVSEYISPLQYVGLGVWMIGFLYESIADWQLARFKQNPANVGKILQSGLWARSRHPNYFGEMLVWWGIFIMAIPLGQWWLSIWSPLAIGWVLLRVSEPMLEQKMRQNPTYRAYVNRTNAFFPKW